MRQSTVGKLNKYDKNENCLQEDGQYYINQTELKAFLMVHSMLLEEELMGEAEELNEDTDSLPG